VWFWLALVCVLTASGCRDRQARRNAPRSPVETAIARDLTARFGTPVTVACTVAAGAPVACTATLADKTTMAISIENASKAEWGWRIDGRVIEGSAIATYVEGELAPLGIKDTVTCGPRIQVLRAGERVSCTLSGGGAAFVHVAADGSTSLELALDKESAAARAELVTPERDQALTEQSKRLEALEGESVGEEAVPTDGGVAEPRVGAP
jgi:hypothetical protein